MNQCIDCGKKIQKVSLRCITCHNKSFEKRKDVSEKSKTHGFTVGNNIEKKFYRTYRHAKERCENPKNKKWEDYGGRGIEFQWNSFEKFKKDMYESFIKHVEEFGLKNTSIDRFPNNNGHYCKENTRWATSKEQAQNKRTNKFITFQGKTQILEDWAKELNIERLTLWTRINRYGWSIKKSFTLPSKIGRNQFENFTLVGKRFGKLVAIKKLDKQSPHNNAYFYLFQCDCGNQKTGLPRKIHDCGFCLTKSIKNS